MAGRCFYHRANKIFLTPLSVERSPSVFSRIESALGPAQSDLVVIAKKDCILTRIWIFVDVKGERWGTLSFAMRFIRLNIHFQRLEGLFLRSFHLVAKIKNFRESGIKMGNLGEWSRKKNILEINSVQSGYSNRFMTPEHRKLFFFLTLTFPRRTSEQVFW